ncbi:zinc-binding dehydrogenase [Saccharothrix violaceirubra]|uniref:NADPH:quinone reductase-like Zn-dependent oxidoreductase n=1 Tax=Saccharothrix violaceirubra TaxID=413306 RepID=A0A7W7T7B8_9PSEU|nr:zinc-binding dehydrogenase [Saccharothrix violaceirubra]MBB4967899.1 NADPH:quinone reductase-like Zn-dependent oxidoreductase [Saccharothrix violaceirubra]
MFAVYAVEPSPQDPLAALRVGERPEPVVPEGWVKVAVRAASLNMHDLWTLRGVGIKESAFPMILGCDGAGVLSDGTEVVLHSIIGDPSWGGEETLDPGRTLLTEKYQGTFADHVVVPARNVLPKPAELSFVEAACMGTAWLTAYRMLFVKSGLRPGQTMLVQGASGGVSTALVRLGRAGGFRVWVTGRTEAKRELASRLGAHAVFEPGARLPERVDAVFETVGKATWSHSLKSLKPGGIVVVSGATSGEPSALEIQRLFFLQLRVVGSTMGTLEELRDLLAFCALNGIRPQVGAELPFERAAEGFAAMWGGDTAGKIVFTR